MSEPVALFFMDHLHPHTAADYLRFFFSSLLQSSSKNPVSCNTSNKPLPKPRKLIPKQLSSQSTSCPDFPALPSPSKRAASSSPQAKQPKSDLARPTSHNSPVPAPPQFHLHCIRLCPHLFVSALHALVTASRLPRSYELSRAVAGHSTHDSLNTYASKVLRQLYDLINFLPNPLRQTLSSLAPLSDLPVSLSAFPVPAGDPWVPPVTASISNADENPPLSKRLTSNLEITWDAVLTLQRRFRGDFLSHPAGTFDASLASRSLASLHPANMDAFAARFVQLVSAASLTSINDKVFRLDARMRKGEGGMNNAVVLHRLPTLVRGMFENPSHVFFLEFLTGVDSARLNAALTPRLAAALAKALRVAASATSNEAFSGAVIDARLFARLLCVTLNAGNWAHSEHAMTGGGQGQGLSAATLKLRVGGHQAAWMINFDVGKVVSSALENRGVHAVVASVAVADVIIRLCAVDPVAKETEWFARALRTLSCMRARPKGGSMFPLLDSMISELVEGQLCSEEIARLRMKDTGTEIKELIENTEACVGIGDMQFVQECCMALEGLRRAVNTPISKQVNVQNEQRMTRRIQPVATEEIGTTSGEEVEDLLKREFVKRMDGRLRELIGVVACSRVEDKDGAEKMYVQVARMLYPSAAETVIRVAAKLCAERVAKIGPQESGEAVGGLWNKKKDRLGDKNDSGVRTGKPDEIVEGISKSQLEGVVPRGDNNGCKAKEKGAAMVKKLEKQLHRAHLVDSARTTDRDPR